MQRSLAPGSQVASTSKQPPSLASRTRRCNVLQLAASGQQLDRAACVAADVDELRQQAVAGPYPLPRRTLLAIAAGTALVGSINATISTPAACAEAAGELAGARTAAIGPVDQCNLELSVLARLRVADAAERTRAHLEHCHTY